MAKSRRQKEQTIADLVEHFSSMKSAVFVNYQGLKVKEADELRRSADKGKVSYIVSKKTLLDKALKSSGVEFDAVALQGMIGVATAEDEVAAAKLLAEFGKTHEALVGLLSAQEYVALRMLKTETRRNQHPVDGHGIQQVESSFISSRGVGL